ncbi:MAG: rod shape-determining protein RodA [Candidatus Abawacabacteria bacterium]|nr:rod shape-determining protein RodA [Candidatus Abawacabacteria bacterium]
MWREFDWWLFYSAVVLSLFGLVVLVAGDSQQNLLASTAFRQTIFLLPSIGLSLYISRTEYRTLRMPAYILYVVGLLVLVSVLVFGVVRNGTRGWFDLGFVQLQPSELVKIPFILALARFWSKKTFHTLKDVVVSLILLIPVLFLVLLQPDLGTALSFVTIWLIIVLALNLPWKQIIYFLLFGTLIAAISFVALLKVVGQDSYQFQRLAVYPDHLLLRSLNHRDAGYQVDQAIIAIGSGKALGAGVGRGWQAQLNYLPVKESDFIFANIAESMGFLGATILILLFVLFLFRTIRVAMIAQDAFGKLMATGFLGMFFFHMVENIGMNMGLLPVTGVPLSFVSYGGSHLITSFIGLGFLQSIIMRHKKIKF